ncbi:hypothetical protein QJS66_00660 [Kocuria rhizophila]|nr:hypothetical protein QJS66_00660 [Kocuria rhizophila]
MDRGGELLFRLSRYQDRLLELYRNWHFAHPQTRSHEIASFVGGTARPLRSPSAPPSRACRWATRTT